MIDLNNITNLSTEDQVKSLVDNVKELQGNVKWLYKYGGSGTGSGSGGSNSASKTFQILVYIGDETYTCTTASTSSISIYPTKGLAYLIPIKVRYMNVEHSYVFRYYLNGSTSPLPIALDDLNSGFITLDKDTIAENGSLLIQGIDTTDGESSITINITYIALPATIQTSLIGTIGTEATKYTIASTELLMSDYSNVYTKVKYTFYNEGTIQYKYKKIGSDEITTVEWYSTDCELGKTYEAELLILDSAFLSEESNLGEYSTDAECYYIPTGSSPQTLQLDDLTLSLIPSSLYVKLIPDSGTIYKEGDTIPSSPYVYQAGSRSFSITIYNGKPDNNKFANTTINIYDEDNNLIKSSGIIINSIGERELMTYTGYIKCTSEIALKYTIKVDFYDDSNVHLIKTYYMYIKKSDLDYNWINTGISYSDLYFNKEDDSNIFTAYNDYIKCNRSDSAITQKLAWTGTSESTEELMFSFGIQFNEVNPSTVKLISIQDSSNPLSNYIDIYQDKVNIGGSSIDIYIPKQNYDAYNTTSGEYHMVQIYRRAVNKIGTSTYYEWVVYIDGVIENTLPAFTQLAITYDTIILNPVTSQSGNFLINHIGAQKFPVGTYIQGYATRAYNGLHDLGVMQYYFKYKDTTALTTDDTNAQILNDVKNFQYSYDNADDDATHNMEPYITVTSTMLNNIVRNSGIPTLVVQVSNQNKDALLNDILDTSWGEEDSFDFDCVTIKYREAGTDTVFNEFTSNDLEKADVVFNLAMQGSSTKGYPVKNFELSIRRASDDVSAIPAFSLDYNPNDDSTFYPESSFTFKADEVDSSHCDNTSCGDIINEYMTPYHTGVKNCLTGKPVLFVLLTAEDGDAYQILGIYNYNLGRESRFNLGHADKPKEVTNTGFIVEGFSTNNYKDNFGVAEISNNSSYWDFSQYDESILFQGQCFFDVNCKDTLNDLGYTQDQLDVYDTAYMFGDIKYNTSKHVTSADIRGSIKNLVKSISDAGGAIFNAIGKTFSASMYQSDTKATNTVYRVENTVPDCKTQHLRYLIDSGTEVYYGFNSYSTSPTLTDIQGVMKTCIYDITDGDTTTEAKLDFTSALQYYVMCMGLGLVDSVQKNLNIKTWDFIKWYIAFYDMDTSFGIDNAGAYISPFAFSDYWKADSTGKVTMSRDYWDPTDTVNTGFDIPSSYLFAIAKYAEFVRSNSTGLTDSVYTLSTPSIEWAKLRSPNGMFRNAKYVVENYFNKKVKSINPFIWNINYRYKYLQQLHDEGQVATSFNSSILKFFHGRRRYYTEDWLNKRFHVLDAYFNINNLASTLNGNITDAVADSSRIDSSIINNEDILIKRSIFGSGTQGIKTSNDIYSTIKVNEFSPFIIVNTKQPNGVKYLFKEADTEYSFDVTVNGNQATNFFGSGSWSYLDSLNCYISSEESLEIHSDLLENLSADITDITPTGWVFYTPSLQSLKLTGTSFSQNLLVYYGENIKTIDLSGTAINIIDSSSAQNLNTFTSLTSLDLTESSATTMNIINATKLETLTLTKAKINTLFVNPIMNSIDISGTHITNMTIKATTDKTGLSFSLTGDDTITTLSLSNFETVTIANCPNLKTITLDEKVKYLTITNCGNLITSYLTMGNTDNVLDLSPCTSLSTLKLSTLSKLQKLILPSQQVTVQDSCFYNDVALTSIEGSIKIVDAVDLFYNCYNLSITTDTPKIAFDSRVTSLKEMFYMPGQTGKIDDTAASIVKNALSSIKNNITSFNSTFRNNVITKLSSFITGSTDAKTKEFTSCSDFSYAFANNDITETITKKLLNIGSDSLRNINNMFEGNNQSGNVTQPSYTKVTFAIDALEYLDTYSNGTRGRLQLFSQSRTGIYISGTSSSTPLKLANFWGSCSGLTTISSATFINAIIDFTPVDTIYAIPSSVTTIDCFMEFYNFTVKNPNKAFSNLSNLSKFTSSWHQQMWTEITFLDERGYNVDEDGNTFYPDIWEMFDWANIYNKLTSVFEMRTDANYVMFDFKKTISYEHFITLLTYMFKSTSITYIDRLFQNCIITDYEDASTYSDNVLKISISGLSNNTTLTLVKHMFDGLSLSNDGYIDFEEGLFTKWYRCTVFEWTWARTKLYKLYKGWFHTNTNYKFTSLGGAFYGAKFLIPYADEISDKKYYYVESSLYYPSVDQNQLTTENRSIPSGWEESDGRGHYIISPNLFDNVSSSGTIRYIFSLSNLFGLLPEKLFSKLDSTNWTSFNLNSAFQATQIVPYLLDTVYEINQLNTDTLKELYKIDIYCYVPNGTAKDPYVYTKNTVNNDAPLAYAFDSKLIIPIVSTSEYHIKIATIQSLLDKAKEDNDGVDVELPYQVDSDTIQSLLGTDLLTDAEFNKLIEDDPDTGYDTLYQNVITVPFTYVYAPYSLSWNNNYVGLMPLACYSEIKLSSTQSFHAKNLNTTDKRIYINLRYGGGINMLDMNKSEDGLPLKSGSTITCAVEGYTFLDSTTASLYYGPIFSTGATIANLNLPDEYHSVIKGWSPTDRGNNNTYVALNYILSRNIYLPRTTTKTLYFATVYKDTSKDTTVIYKLLANSAQLGNNTTMKNYYSEVFTFD